MPPSPTTVPTGVKALLATSGLVLVAGAALAIAQPGDLGDDDGDDTAGGQTPTSGVGASSTVLPGPSDTVVTLPGSDVTGTTGPGSGLGTDGASVADDGTAATGIESMLAPGLGLVAAAGLARAAARRPA